MDRLERMHISRISVVQRNGIMVARARAEAKDARIWLEVIIIPPSGADIWGMARDEVLRYLDP